jgi:acyl carrier protein
LIIGDDTTHTVMAWATFSTLGADSVAVIVIIFILLIAAYGISIPLDKLKKKKG